MNIHDYHGIREILEKTGLAPICLRRLDPGKVEKAFFALGGDPRKYDSAQQVTVLLSRNETVKICVENAILDSSLSTRTKLDRLALEISTFARSLTEESESQCSSGTGIHLITEESGQVRFKPYEETDIFRGFIELPEIPESLKALPTVHITDLTRLEQIAYAVDLVEWSGNKYAFKKTLNASASLTEISSLHALRNCDAINPPLALVIDSSTTSSSSDITPRIRGFLSRFLPGGSLGALLSRREAQRAAGGPQVSIPWRTKVTWVISLARALLAMRSLGLSPNGDLKPDNVMLDGRGRIRLVDFAPAGPTAEWGAPEYVVAWDAFRARELQPSVNGKSKSRESTPAGSLTATATPDLATFDFQETLTPAMDIYGLGAIMWALGEEKASGLETRTWELSAEWYREIAEWCLRPDPASRPSAGRLMFSLVGRSLMSLIRRD